MTKLLAYGVRLSFTFLCINSFIFFKIGYTWMASVDSNLDGSSPTDPVTTTGGSSRDKRQCYGFRCGFYMYWKVFSWWHWQARPMDVQKIIALMIQVRFTNFNKSGCSEKQVKYQCR